MVRKLWHTSGLWPCRPQPQDAFCDSPDNATQCRAAAEGGGGERVFYVRCLSLYYYLLPASCPLMWLPVSPRAENSDGCSFTSISLRRLFNLFVCMNRKNVHDIASSAISSTELKRERQNERERMSERVGVRGGNY